MSVTPYSPSKGWGEAVFNLPQEDVNGDVLSPSQLTYQLYFDGELKFGADFPQFKKSDVNGANELPLYTWLKSQKPCQGGYEAKLAAVMEKLYNEANPEPRKKDDIQWNFTKFLISRDGQVIARFEPTVDMKEVEKQTEAAL